MQRSDKHIRNDVFHDCAVAMAAPLAMIVTGNLITELLNIYTARIFGDFADAVFALDVSIGLKNVVLLVICILSITVFAPIFNMLGNFVMLRNALRHDNMVFGRFLQRDMQNVLKCDLGELQYQLEDAPNDLRIYWTNFIGQALVLPFGWAYLLYCAGNISWLLTAIMIAISMLKLALSIFLCKQISKNDKAEQSYNAARRAYETDMLHQPYIIKMFGLKVPLIARIDRLFMKYYKQSGIRQMKVKAATEALPTFIDKLTTIIVFAAGAVYVAHGTISPGKLAAMVAYIPIAQALLDNMSGMVENYQLMMNASIRVGEFYRDAESDCGNEIFQFKSIVGKNVSFQYSDETVLKEISFSINRGDKIRITGENGSGKSTLIKIVCGLLKNYKGDIYLNGDDFKAVNVIKWRQIISYAPQTPYLFRTTVRENITFDDDTLLSENAEKLMNAFSILPLAEKQVTADNDLSGGEKQKISIIRALLRKSDILILDEPTNHLDAGSIDFLRQWLSNEPRTVIIITHSHELDDVISKCLNI